MALWWINDPAELTTAARDLIADGRNDVFLSAASVWEVAIKVSVGRLEVPGSFGEAAASAGFRELPICWADAAAAATLPALHRDPFDRMLVAQAIRGDLVVLTRDPVVSRYPVRSVPA